MCVITKKYRHSIIRGDIDTSKRVDTVNHIFGRCKACGSTTIHGFCRKCLFHVSCAWCSSVKGGDGVFRIIDKEDLPGIENAKTISHGTCLECSKMISGAREVELAIKQKNLVYGA